MKTLRNIRLFPALVSPPLACALSLGAWLAGCGGPAEAAKAPAPAKVVWTRADGTTESDAPANGDETSSAPAAEGDAKRAAPADDGNHAGAKEVDLDELAAQKELQAQKAQKAPKSAAKESASAAAPPPASPQPEAEPAEPAAAAQPAAPVPLGKEMHAAVKTKDSDKEKPGSKSASAKKPAAAAAAAEPATPAYDGPNPCKTVRFSVPRVEEACGRGGRQAAKGVMKDAIGKALAAGASLKCGDCHAEQKDYTLKKDAVAQLKKWLGS
jgi:hypothetical protein